MTEQQPYDVLERRDGFELRRYPAHLVAEVEVDGSFSDSGNRAFGALAGFIGGRNSARTTVAMTAPVVQEQAGGTRISMTSPVVQQPGARPGRYVVGFVMPSGFTEETLPMPTDPRVRIRTVPEQVAAAVQFRGRWTEKLYAEHAETLRRAVAAAGLAPSGPMRFARFDPPWTPWFRRRNEVVLPVTGA